MTVERESYHHGDLRSALVDVALELVAERGPRGFSLAEASRRAGVSVSAPYRHFAGRDELLAAVAERGYEEIRARQEAAAAATADPAEKLARAAAAYVRFAAERRAMFDALFGAAAVDKASHPRLLETAQKGWKVLLGPAQELLDADGEEAAAFNLALSVVTVAHGHAALLADGAFGPPDEVAGEVAGRAAAAVRALLRGRSLLATGR